MDKKLVAEMLRTMPRKNSKNSGKARIATLIPDEQVAIARKAAAASAKERARRKEPG